MDLTARTTVAASDDHGPRRIGDVDMPSLRIGFAEARPWSYRAERTVQGLDVVAIEYVSARLGRSPDYHARQSADLASGLLAGDYELAIGGLLPERHRDIVTVPVPHAQVWSGSGLPERARIRRAFFPNVWWIRRTDLSLRLRVRVLLLAWRLSMRPAAKRAACAR